MSKSELSEQIKDILRLSETKIKFGVGSKILVPFFGVMLIVVASLSYFVISEISDKMEQMSLRRAAVVLDSTILKLDSEIETVETYAHFLGDSVEVKNALENGDKKKLYQILVGSKQYSRLQKILIFDETGQIAIQVANSPVLHQDASLLIKKGLSGITTSTLTVSDNGLEIYAVTPLRAGIEEYNQGYVMLLDRHIGSRELNEIKKREGVEITIINDRTVVASTLEPALADKVLEDISELQQQGQLIYSKITAKEVDYINVWRSVGSKGLISVMVPNSDLMAVKTQLSRDIIQTTLIAVVLVFICASIVAKVMVAPLQRMLRITKAITRGDFNQKIDNLSRDEFGELGEAINYMGERIKERLDYAEHLATVDGLTGLYNHRFFQQRLEQEIQRAIRSGIPLSLIILDIDYFKHYNDTLGHPAGDKVLQEIGEILLKSIRTIDVAARYGGEEFAVILVGSASADALVVGERIRSAVEEYPFDGRAEQPSGKVTVSLGVATFPDNANNKEDLIKLADNALYKAKYMSKNKVVLYYSVLDELKKELDKSEHDLLNTVKTLISVINSRDKYTFGHSERVVLYTTMIARELKFDERELKSIQVAAFLHDIGKIEIGRIILNKDQPLNDEEMDLLKQHPSWGAQIVSSINSLKGIVPTILYHHEKYDGTGYPAGLSGKDIPMHARILKVADSFDAMTSFRPYQATKTYTEAQEELISCCGTDFDPYVVEVFLKVMNEEDGGVKDVI